MTSRTSSRSLIILATICITGMAVGSALAAVTPIAQSRQISTFAFLDPAPGQEPLRSDETIQSEADGEFSENAVCHVERFQSQVTALAEQASVITADGVTASFEASAEGTLLPPAQGTLGIASSGLLYNFEVDVPTYCRLIADIEATGDGVIDIGLQNLGSTFVFRHQYFDTEESVDETLLLAPGSYQLSAGGGGDGATGPNGIGTSFIALDFAMSFPSAASTPAPVSVGSILTPVITPNPAHDLATISFAGPVGREVEVKVLDVAGRLVRGLSSTAGASLVWDTRDQRGEQVPPGVYFVRSESGGRAITRKLVIAR